jgi:hypothetical protein
MFHPPWVTEIRHASTDCVKEFERVSHESLLGVLVGSECYETMVRWQHNKSCKLCDSSVEALTLRDFNTETVHHPQVLRTGILVKEDDIISKDLEEILVTVCIRHPPNSRNC